MEHFRAFLKIVPPEKNNGKEPKTNVRANKKATDTAEKWVEWRNAVYTPVVSKFPTKQQLKRRYGAVTSVSSALFKSMLVSMDGHATPYTHHMLHTQNYLKRDCLDRSGESLEHKNKKLKHDGVFISHHLPSAANLKTSVALSMPDVQRRPRKPDRSTNSNPRNMSFAEHAISGK